MSMSLHCRVILSLFVGWMSLAFIQGGRLAAEDSSEEQKRKALRVIEDDRLNSLLFESDINKAIELVKKGSQLTTRDKENNPIASFLALRYRHREIDKEPEILQPLESQMKECIKKMMNSIKAATSAFEEYKTNIFKGSELWRGDSFDDKTQIDLLKYAVFLEALPIGKENDDLHARVVGRSAGGVLDIVTYVKKTIITALFNAEQFKVILDIQDEAIKSAMKNEIELYTEKERPLSIDSIVGDSRQIDFGIEAHDKATKLWHYRIEVEEKAKGEGWDVAIIPLVIVRDEEGKWPDAVVPRTFDKSQKPEMAREVLKILKNIAFTQEIAKTRLKNKFLGEISAKYTNGKDLKVNEVKDIDYKYAYINLGAGESVDIAVELNMAIETGEKEMPNVYCYGMMSNGAIESFLMDNVKPDKNVGDDGKEYVTSFSFTNPTKVPEGIDIYALFLPLGIPPQEETTQDMASGMGVNRDQEDLKEANKCLMERMTSGEWTVESYHLQFNY